MYIKSDLILKKITKYNEKLNNKEKIIKDEKYFLNKIFEFKDCKEYWTIMDKLNRFLRLENIDKLNVNNLYKYLFNIRNNPRSLKNMCISDYTNDKTYYDNLKLLKEENLYIKNLNLISSINIIKKTKNDNKPNKKLDIKNKLKKLISMFKSKTK